MSIRLLPLIAALLISGCAQHPQDLARTSRRARPVGTTLKLADWNMEFLAEKNGSGCNPRGDADYASMRRTVDSIDADVFAFEEVENEAAAARVFDPAKYTVLMEMRAGRPGGSCGGAHAGQTFIRQAVGVAIRKGLPFDRQPDVTELQLGNPNLRSGVDVTVRPTGGEPVRVLAIHLKSGCFQGTTGQACSQLLGQIPVVRTWVQEAATHGPRFVIMGDWNRRLALPGDAFWTTIDGGTSPSSHLVLADRQVTPRCDPRYHDFIDHIVLDARAGARASGFAETTFPAGQRPSDHCPVSILLSR